MESFDDALNEHKRLLTESLINFDEGQRVRKIMLDIDSNSADYEYYFQAGQQSKQAEVDELNNKLKSIETSSKECLNAMSLSCSHYLNENKKLLKAIEDIKTYLAEAPNKHVSQTAMLKVLDILDILKGDQS